MSRTTFQMRWRRAYPWLLFTVWLTASAAQLSTLEIEAVRAGLFSCRADASPTVSKDLRWIQDRLK
jgi:hypothetical protein